MASLASVQYMDNQTWLQINSVNALVTVCTSTLNSSIINQNK